MCRDREENASDLAWEEERREETKQRGLIAAESALTAVEQSGGLEGGQSPTVRVYHLLCALLHYCDKHKLSIDAELGCAREDYDEI